MAIYPKQLQLYPANSYAGTVGNRIRESSSGDRVVITDGFTPPSDMTVNSLIYDIGSVLYGVDLTGITYGVRTRPRDRLFKSSFGDIVVFPASTPISGNKTANELISIMRVLWDADRLVAFDGIGYATSVQN